MQAQNSTFQSRKPVDNGKPGVYRITNTLNGCSYVGSTQGLKRRIADHQNKLRRGAHRNRALQNAYNETPSSFEFVTMEIVLDKHRRLDREQFWMDALQCHVDTGGYNKSPTAQHNRGIRFSEESLKRMRIGQANSRKYETRIGIYRVRHTVSGKCYVGCSKSLVKRLASTRSSLFNGSHHNRELQLAYTASPKTFVVEIIEFLPDATTLVVREQFWIDELSAATAGYNRSPTGGGSNKGMKATPETIDRITEMQRARFVDGKRSPLLGTKRCPEVAAKLGRYVRPPKQREAIAQNNRERNKRGECPWLGIGRPHSEETKKKISARFEENRQQRCQLLRDAWAKKRANGEPFHSRHDPDTGRFLKKGEA